MKTFITSDPHFFHKTTLKWDMRKRFNTQVGDEIDKDILYQDTLTMNEEIINNWNSVVGKNDEIYILGDISFASPNKTREVLERLNGKKYLILGNHDKMKNIKKLKDLFESIDYYKEIKHRYKEENYHMCLMHYPIQQWNRKHYNSMMLCGHSHGMLDHKVEEGHIKYDVGVDTKLANFYPILMDDIIIKTQEVIPNF